MTLPFAKKRRLAWLLTFALSGFVAYGIDFRMLGHHAGPFMHITFCLAALVGFTAMLLRDLGTFGGILSMSPKDWQRDFDEANRLMKQKSKKRGHKESNAS